jgi:GT2 family glycosyltransferase
LIKLSIITVNYKGWKPLARCLDSLKCLKDADFESEVIVVDNASKDGILEDFRSKYPEVTFIENSGNNGFANGNNVGANKAEGEYLLFLNPDTSATIEPLSELLKAADKHPEYGIVSCRQENESGKDDKACGLFLKPATISGISRAIYKALNKKELDRINCGNRQVLFPDWISGSLVLIKKEFFHSIGGWDEDYWIYYEDSDLCKKVWESGKKVAYLCNVTLMHSHGGVTRRNHKAKAFFKTEVMISRHVYVRNHFKGFKKHWMQTFMVLNNLILEHLFPAFLGLLFFFIPSIQVNLKKYLHVISYYWGALWNQTWLSPRSLNNPNHKTEIDASI